MIFGVGATSEIAKPFGLVATQVVELVRVALSKHQSAVSRIIAIALKIVHKANPGVRVVVSFADSSQGHHGGIYQAGGWAFIGSQEYHAYRILGEIVHPRTCYHRYGVGGQSIPWLKANVDANAERIANGIKHKYVMPLDAEMRARIEPLRKPYPKRERSADSGTPGYQSGGGGANPTRSLQVTGGKEE
ncbi:MAG: protein Mom [Rhodobacteraceae bacterium]|nr:protein Mom [Paracoccaceae bacterium]